MLGLMIQLNEGKRITQNDKKKLVPVKIVIRAEIKYLGFVRVNRQVDIHV